MNTRIQVLLDSYRVVFAQKEKRRNMYVEAIQYDSSLTKAEIAEFKLKSSSVLGSMNTLHAVIIDLEQLLDRGES